jgi:hypothetical protein
MSFIMPVSWESELRPIMVGHVAKQMHQAMVCTLRHGYASKGVLLSSDGGGKSNKPRLDTGSPLRNLLRDNRLELPWLLGKVVALSRELRAPTPTTTYCTRRSSLTPMVRPPYPRNL